MMHIVRSDLPIYTDPVHGWWYKGMAAYVAADPWNTAEYIAIDGQYVFD